MSAIQAHMARAALRLTTRALAREVGLSATAISRYERGDETALSVATAARLQNWFEQQRVFFGPKQGVCLGENVFYAERWFSLACYQLLQEASITPSSSELLAAYQRAESAQYPPR